MSDVTSTVEMSVAMFKAQLDAKFKAGLRRGAEIARAEAAKGGLEHQGHINPVIIAIESEIAKGET